jgi:hypothetical protein
MGLLLIAKAEINGVYSSDGEPNRNLVSVGQYSMLWLCNCGANTAAEHSDAESEYQCIKTKAS